MAVDSGHQERASGQQGDLIWIGLYGTILCSWLALFVLSLDHEAVPLAGVLSSGFDLETWIAICSVSPAEAPFFAVLAMWALMAQAMMLPTALPMIRSYQTLTEGRDMPGRQQGVVGLVAGYLSVWLGFAVLAAALQVLLARYGLLSPHGILLSPWLTIGFLAIAGLYQFSALKDACVRACQSPLFYLMSNWRHGFKGGTIIGFRNGLACLGCCWALMMLGFVGGTMNLFWMGCAMLVMIGEKLPGPGRYITAPLGYILLASAGYAAARLLL
ncbi:DUF2182 domain-containing protein [Coralliovum pocilloporae]|uniref:DUF2182 domain-containing protein n=1 Tax=Coralliovum pocilloporae TaxID=3066369 RepID=UPI003307698A